MLSEFGPRRNYPYVLGAMLAANAVSDVFLFVDGPTCTFRKAQNIFGSHDWQSTLLDVRGRHRIVHSGLHPDRVAEGHEQLVAALLAEMGTREDAALLLLTALPMAYVTGLDYEGLVRTAGECGASVALLPRASLDRDWLDGWAEALRAMAAHAPLAVAERQPDRVAVVGLWSDRNEGDHGGNRQEIRRLVEALDLHLCGLWPDGGPLASLAPVAEADTIFALPWGRAAARTLAQRSGARLVDVDVPFGIDATERFLRTIAAATGREAAAERLIEAESRRVARAWEWLLPKRLLHRRVAFSGDPHWMPGLGELASLLGFDLGPLLARSRPRPALVGELPVVWEPRGREPAADAADVDLWIAGSDDLDVLRACGVSTLRMEFGFPSRRYHVAHAAPFLGYEGALCFVDRLANALAEKA